MTELLDGFVPGLPADLRDRILARSEGVPLYAVETVRMLLDRGLLSEDEGVYRPTGEVAELDVPETLHGLIAARLDGLSAEERRLLQDGSVLGKTFTKESLAELLGCPKRTWIRSSPASCARRCSASRPTHARLSAGSTGSSRTSSGVSPTRRSLDAIARRATSRAAAQLERSFGAVEQEVVEVVAAHYLAAYEAQPDADDAREIKARARELLARAAERAGSLGALGQARRSYEQAAELADEPVERALLLELASRKALSNAEFEAAEQALRAALELLEQTGEPRAAARVSGRLGNLEVQTGRGERGMRRMEEAFAAVSADEPDADMAYLAGRLGRSLALAGELERAAEANELALGVAQALRLPETLVRALGTKAYLARAAGRPEEELALTRHALRYALENDLAEQSANQYANLSDSCFGGDRYGEALEALGEAVALARRSGERAAEVFALSETTYALTMTGRWDEAVAIFDELPEEQLRADTNLSSVLCGVLEIFLHRGQIERSRELHSWFDYVPTEDHQSHAIHIAAQAELLHAEGRFAEAMDAGAYAAEVSNVPQAMKQGLVWTVESALALGEPGRADELLRRSRSARLACERRFSTRRPNASGLG